MLDMLTRLNEGEVLKPKNCKEEKIPYIMILKNRSTLFEFYKTVKFSKKWEDNYSKMEVKINKYDFTNYKTKILKGSLRYLDEEEAIRLKECVDELPEKTKSMIYMGDDINIFMGKAKNYQYGFEMQNISRLEDLSNKVSDKIYKKALSIIPFLHL